MTTRVYASPAREAAAAEKKARVVAAATALLRQEKVTAVSLDAVAKAAGVTRLTVYNQFGSRRGLLEAVLDQVAHDAGFDRIGEVMQNADPRAALDHLIDLVCHAWGHDDSMGGLHAAAQIDPEFAEAVDKRIERRRNAIRVLVNRMSAERPLGDAAKKDLVDLLFAMTSYPVFGLLRSAKRSPQAVAGMMKAACQAVLRPLSRA
jgi:AcrR family transcriptional regulator